MLQHQIVMERCKGKKGLTGTHTGTIYKCYVRNTLAGVGVGRVEAAEGSGKGQQQKGAIV